MQWLGDQQTDPEEVHLFRRYLSGCGTRTMTSLLGQPSQYRLAAEYHDRLRWDNFLEGRISALWVELRARDIHDRHLERNTDYWASGLMCRLLEMVHQQWLYRNATVHMSLQDGLPRDKHEQILTRIEGCLPRGGSGAPSGRFQATCQEFRHREAGMDRRDGICHGDSGAHR
jgi:hypothetical protein